MAPKTLSSRDTDEGRKTKIRVQKLDDLVAAARELGRRSIAVAGAEDREVLLAVRDAVESEFASAILVGDQSRITAVAEQVGINLDSIGVEIVDVPYREGWGVEVAKKTVELITSGKATVLVKGKLDTGELLRAVLDRDAGLRSGSLLTHVGLFDVPGLDRILYISDGGVVLNPTLRQKLQITRNAVDVAHTLGLAMPKVAILAAAEMVNEEMPTTVDAAALSKMADRGQITGALVDGPFGLDNAISAAAADTKGLRGPVAGQGGYPDRAQRGGRKSDGQGDHLPFGRQDGRHSGWGQGADRDHLEGRPPPGQAFLDCPGSHSRGQEGWTGLNSATGSGRPDGPLPDPIAGRPEVDTPTHHYR